LPWSRYISWTRLKYDIKTEINQFTGKNSNNISQALWCLRDMLHSSLPGMVNVDLAAQLVNLASQLVLNPKGSLEEHYAYKKVSDLMYTNVNHA